jgi:4-nitrophenyl phosphatase
MIGSADLGRQMNSIRHLIIDMDGVLWRGNTPIPGLIEFFDTLRRQGITFILATNNASLTPEQYMDKLAGMGVAVARGEVLTSAQAAALHLAQQPRSGARAFVIGEDGLRQALAERGFVLTGDYEPGADYVVVGMDRGLTFDKLATATLSIRAGAQFVGTNGDTSFPSERGIIHGNGAILAALAAATGAAPAIIGKPEPIMYQLAMERLGGTAQDTWALGDRLETDILGAVRTGIRSILVLSGVTTAQELAASDVQPDVVLPSIAELNDLLCKPPTPSSPTSNRLSPR